MTAFVNDSSLPAVAVVPGDDADVDSGRNGDRDIAAVHLAVVGDRRRAADVRSPSAKGLLIGSSPAMARIRAQIGAAVDAGCRTVLLQGETGTGKEVVADALHLATRRDGRDRGPFVAVSCPAIPETLVESELFGHVRGSFTGAIADRPGCFETADGGTLFLDEVADLSPAAQAKLLRVLETRTVKRIGGVREIAVDVRLIAATNAPLEELVAARKFRQDLFYRLNVFRIDIPPLRERREDILPLGRHFMHTHLAGRGLPARELSPAAERLLVAYDYPGNGRELRNVIERAAVASRGLIIDAQHLLLPSHIASHILAAVPVAGRTTKETMLLALERTRWNRQRAALELGVPYSTFRYRIKKLGLQ
ncbi:MAG: sigma-54-dependent Fis family transcriptional regulator [Deltaproteobacteria bacterium]|nr:sigma-54-dependent Fis family transcriptional regulator [Deltaproteobacteria bacterium]